MKPNWEFGSFIHWFDVTAKTEPSRPWGRNCVFTASARHALRLILRQTGTRRLWLPTYFPRALSGWLRQLPIDLAFYRDSPLDSSLDLGDLSFREGDACLVINYFGLRREEDVKVDRPPGVLLVEDHTHGPFSRWTGQSVADFCLASLRKTLPVPDGAAVWSPSGFQLPQSLGVTEESSLASRMILDAMLLKALRLKGHAVDPGSYTALYREGDERLGQGRISGISGLTSQLLSGFPFSAWETARRRNFQRFLWEFTSAECFRILLPRDEDEPPYSVVCLFDEPEERDRLLAHLRRHSVYPSILWRLDAADDEIPEEHRLLSRCLFALPCDGRYGEADIECVVDAFRSGGFLRPKLPLVIPKEPAERGRYTTDRYFTCSARAGLEHLLRHACPDDSTVLLPAYIGRSPLEGSGVFDPVVSSGRRYAFYRLNESLEADLGHIQSLCDQAPISAVVVIHYFGIPQPDTLEIRRLCDTRGILLIEDCAHTCGSRLSGRQAGTIGDATIYSIHKLLPCKDGGILQINNSTLRLPPIDPELACSSSTIELFANTDWEAICRRRKDNFRILRELLRPVVRITLFSPDLDEHVTPMNLPVLVDDDIDRFDVYRKLRQRDVGVTALYHTLIEEIHPRDYPASFKISRRILNLPIHQDISPEQLERAAAELDLVVNGRRST
jgi:dTDP-4-amino-4,6-dideoxygalactose transaminase